MKASLKACMYVIPSSSTRKKSAMVTALKTTGLGWWDCHRRVNQTKVWSGILNEQINYYNNIVTPQSNGGKPSIRVITRYLRRSGECPQENDSD